MARLLLVDGHSNLYRAFYAIRSNLKAPDGTPTGATFGFLRMQHKLLRELEPTHVGVAFDVSRETFRTRMSERYKAQRPPMPEDLQKQVPITQEALRALGLAVLAVEDVEADDVIGSLAQTAAAAGLEVVIASSDKDLMQVVRDPHIRMWHTRLERLLDEKGVEEVFGVPPARVTQVLTLMGDASDNIPGCPGIGEKGAKDLIARWGTVDEIYAHLDEVTPPRCRKALTEHRDEVALSAELVRIRTDLALPLGLEALVRGEPETDALAALYQRLGFASLLAEANLVRERQPGASAQARVMDRTEVERVLAGAGPLGIALEGEQLAVATAQEVGVAHLSSAATAKVLAPRLGTLWCYDAKRIISALRDAGVTHAQVPRDVMLAGYLLAPGEPTDLAALCRRAGVDPPALGPVGQAQAVQGLLSGTVEGLHREGLERVFEEIELPLVPILESMERHGIAIDKGVLADLARRLDDSMASLQAEIHSEAGGEFNLNSPQQLADVLFARRGLPVIRRTSKTRAPSTDADVLAELAGRGHRLPALILEYREQAKLKSTYVDALPRQVAADGRVHTRFNQAVTATGRLSSSEPNLQNIPIRTELGREVRRAFVAEKGWSLVATDYSQIELRVLAHLSGDPGLMDAFAHGEDIHRATAALVFEVSPDLVSAEMRRAAKTINFGLIYGMGAFALGRELGVSSAEAQRFIDAYFTRRPRVKGFMEETKDQARRTGKATTMFGRVRWIAGLDSHNGQVRGNAERMAMNAPIQGTAADIMKLAMIRVASALAPLKDRVRLLLQVHDELVFEVEPRVLTEVQEVVRQAMEEAAELRVPLKVEIGVGDSWAKAKG